MHELALMESLVAAVEENVAAGRVVCVRLEVGKLTAVLPDALRFGFEVCTRGTRLEEATLEIVEIEGRGRCRTCGEERPLEVRCALCPCGSAELEIVAGEELRIRELEVI